MMLTQPVKGGIALSSFTAPPSSWELAGSTELRGSHHAPGGSSRGSSRNALRPRSRALGHNRSVGTTLTRQGMRATTEEAAPTRLPGLEGPELRAPPVGSRSSGPVIRA